LLGVGEEGCDGVTMALAATLEDKLEKVKPALRGTFHTFGFVASVFGIVELALSPTEGWRYVAGVLYGCSLTLMLGLSALYHRPMWSHAARNRLRMADHIGIYFLISGTYTPVAALVSPRAPTRRLRHGRAPRRQFRQALDQGRVEGLRAASCDLDDRPHDARGQGFA
jgi:hypothetical protein